MSDLAGISLVTRHSRMLLCGMLVLAIATSPVVSGRAVQVAVPSTQREAMLRASDAYITEDVEPLDASNRFISDLTKDEFTILEDGVEQTVETCKPFIGGRSVGTGSAVVMSPTTTSSGRVFVIFVDDLHVPVPATPRLKDVLNQIKTTLLHDGDLISVISSGPSSIEIARISELNRLDDARRSVMGTGQAPEDILRVPPPLGEPEARRFNVAMTFSAAYNALLPLQAVPEQRKAFIYVSGGYDFNPLPSGGPLYNIANPFLKPAREFSESDLVAELAELTGAANRLNTSFHTLDPRGLMSNAAPGGGLPADSWSAYVQKSQSSLHVLADATAGTAMMNINDFKKGLSAIDTAMNDYYILGYHSSNLDPAHRQRKVEIRVGRPGVHLLPYRGAYSLK